MRYIAILLAAILTVSQTAHAADPKVEVLAKSDKMWNGTPLPDVTNTHTEVSILRITIPPHSEIPMHKHPMINAGYLLSGKLTVISEKGEHLDLKTGDTLIELVNQWHMGRNDGDEPAVIVVFYLGSIGEPLTIKRISNSDAGLIAERKSLAN